MVHVMHVRNERDSISLAARLLQGIFAERYVNHVIAVLYCLGPDLLLEWCMALGMVPATAQYAGHCRPS